MIKKIVVLIMLILVGFIFNTEKSYAEEGLSNKVDFFTALKYAIENNNNIRALRKNLSGTERDIGITKSLMLPKITFHENFMVTNNPIEAFSIKLNQTRATHGDLSFGTLDYPGATVNFLTSGVVEQTILDKKALIGIKIAKKEFSANGYLYLRQEEELINSVAKAYLSVISNQQIVEIHKKSVEEAKKTLEAAQEKYIKKSIPFTDLINAKTMLMAAEDKLSTAKNELELAQLNLGVLLGVEFPVENSSPMPDLALHELNYYKEIAIYRNDIKAMEIKVKTAAENIKFRQADFYPTLKAVASYNFYNRNYPFGGEGNNYIVGTYLRWEIFDGNKRHFEILKAQDKEAEVKEYLEGLKKEVNFKVYEKYVKTQNSKKKLEQSIALFKESEAKLKIVQDSWQKGAEPVTSLMEAQANLETEEINLINNQLAFGQALLDLIYESGIINQELGM